MSRYAQGFQPITPMGEPSMGLSPTGGFMPHPGGLPTGIDGQMAPMYSTGISPNAGGLPTPGGSQMAPTTTSSSGGGFWSDTLGGFGDWIGNNGNALAQIGSIAGVLNNASDIRNMGHEQQQWLQEQGNNLNQGSQFNGYGVTSGLGSSTVGTDGGINLGVGQNAGMSGYGNNMLANGQGALNSAAGLNHGQSSVNWSGMGENGALHASLMDVNSGPYGANSQALYDRASGMNASTGQFGDNSQEAYRRGMDMEASTGPFGDNSAELYRQALNTNASTGQYGANSLDAYQRGMGMEANNGVFGEGAEQAMRSALADPTKRQEEIFGQLMGMQQPGLDAAQAQQQAREYAMGRGGVMGSQFGGTAEDAAMAKARAQASNEAALGAMKQADAERGMLGQMAAQFGQVGNQDYANKQSTADSYLNTAAQQGQLGNTNFANEQSVKDSLLNASSQQGQLGIQNYANEQNTKDSYLNTANQQGQLGIQNYANEQNTIDSLYNAASQQGQLGNQQYQNMANYQNNIASQAAQYGQLGNNAINANANYGNMLSGAGSSMGQLGLSAQEQSYLPMEMQMKLLEQGRLNADMSQTGQLTGQDYLAQMLLGGSNANINAQKVSSELQGNLYDSILDNLGGAGGTDGSSVSGLGGLLSSLGGGMDGLMGLFGFGGDN